MGYFSQLIQKLGISKNRTANNGAESYLALTLTPDTVTACTWQFVDEKVETRGISSKHYANTQNLVHEAAVAIDKAVEAASSDVDKVVFGLSSNWFEGDNLKAESSKILNNLGHDLDLSAQAYVSLATAVNHFLKMEEGVTPNAVLMGIFDDFCEAHLVQNNKILSTEKLNAKAEVGAVVDLIHKLKEKHNQLPSRLIIYGKPTENLNTRLGNRNWSDIFLHAPKIELLDAGELAKAVAYAQAVDILGYDPNVPGSARDFKQKQSQKNEEAAPKEDAGNNLGFVEGEDILLAKHSEESTDEHIEDSESETGSQPDSNTAQENNFQPEFREPEDYAVQLESNVSSPDYPETNNLKPQSKRKKPGLGFPNPLAVFSFIKFRPSAKSLGIAALVLIVLSVVGVYAAGQMLTSARVIIKVNAKPQEADFKAQVISNSSDIPSGQLPGTIVKGTADGSQKMVASGSKKTGTKSKGQIKILNWDKSSAKTFASGTQVITKDGLKFTIDSEIEVASRSATTPGENKVAATAFEIGPNYNINSGVDLTIVGFDEVFYSGVTDTAFTGGDEKQITVASQDDLTRLEKQLNDTLSQKAKEELSTKSEGRKIYDEARTIKVIIKEFDKKADEEASLINLNMTLEVSALTFDENDLKTYLAKTAQEKADKNLESRPENIEILNLSVKSQKDTLVLSGRFRANLTPKIEEDPLREKIAGLTSKKAREEIKSSAEISDVQIVITPGIPFIDSIPKDKSKISFEVVTL